MHTLRRYLAWLFALASFAFLQAAVFQTLFIFRTHNGVRIPEATFNPRVLISPAILIVLSALFATAWWTEWRGKPSGRAWGIAASLLNILVPVAIVYLAGYGWSDFTLLLAIGVVGLVAFWRRYDPKPTENVQRIDPLPGDGTNSILNKIAPYAMYALAYVVYLWWFRWLIANDVPYLENSWLRILSALLVGLVITIVHELGHAISGILLGMKLRGFLAGPFQWHIREGRWEFQFRPQSILSADGATGLVPVVPGFPRRSFLLMTAAGPAINIVTGIATLWIAFRLDGESPWQVRGLTALFGAWSLTLGAMNLLPFRTRALYSDGARIYQLLSNGLWGDFYRILALIGSTVVTPLRPRDYEIDIIQRVALSITQGQQGLLLQLFAYNHYLDLGKLNEASEALPKAESIYHQSASNISAELHTVFVFGNAYVRGDAVAAREWWTRMQARKPTRFNADYWRANAALHWIEGNFNDADVALKKSEDLAEKLPKAGAYEFDRYCNSLLRKALDEANSSGLVPAGTGAGLILRLTTTST